VWPVEGRAAATPKLMAAEHVERFRLSCGAKNDRNDAQAILRAVLQPDMRFVSVKSLEQQAMLAWHRSRSGFLEERTHARQTEPAHRVQAILGIGEITASALLATISNPRDLRPISWPGRLTSRIQQGRVEKCSLFLRAAPTSRI
jgi:transposase